VIANVLIWAVLGIERVTQPRSIRTWAKVRRVLYISCATVNIKEKGGERNAVHTQGCGGYW
jgi:hypothetical protein